MGFKLNAIKQKWNSQKGTSIFFGLLLFLAASILSAVMISAAATTIKRVESDRKAEQNYLTCSSAATMLRDGIVGAEIVYKKQKEEEFQKQKNSYEKLKETTSESWSSSVTAAATGSLQTVPSISNLLCSYMEGFYKNPSAAVSPFTKECTISVPDADKGKTEMTDVKAVFTISKRNDTGLVGTASEYGCNIVIKLSTGEKTDSCKMVVSLLGSVSGPATESANSYSNGNMNKTITTTTTRTYTWTTKDIIFGEQERTAEGT